MLIGRSVLDAEDTEELIEKKNLEHFLFLLILSKQIISFIIRLLQYESTKRLQVMIYQKINLLLLK